jgi:hypothetical protein
VLPLISVAAAGDVGIVLIGVLAAVGAVAPDRVLGARRRSALPTVCLLAAVAHVAFRPLSAPTSVAEAVLIAGYLVLSGEAEVCRDAPSMLLRWAATPFAVAVLAACGAAEAAHLAARSRVPLALAVAGVAAVGLLFLELHRRRRVHGSMGACGRSNSTSG